jgi:hypothetical protein
MVGLDSAGMPRYRKVASVLFATAVATGISGCAGQASSAVPPATLAPLSGVVATGTLIGIGHPDPISGTVTVLANPSNGSLTVKFASLAGNVGSIREAELSVNRVKVDSTCTPYGLAYSAGPMTNRPNQQVTLPSDKSPGWENPSFLHSVILTSNKPAVTGCAVEIAAYAPLKWTVGDRRPDIHVIDGGTRTGAEGHALTVDGKLRSYTVISGDNLDSIASRFHLTLSELFYLNPARTPSPVNTTTEIGEVLNLSKSYR